MDDEARAAPRSPERLVLEIEVPEFNVDGIRAEIERQMKDLRPESRELLNEDDELSCSMNVDEEVHLVFLYQGDKSDPSRRMVPMTGYIRERKIVP